VNGASVFGSVPLAADIARPGEAPWVRWTRTGRLAHAFVSAPKISATGLSATGIPANGIANGKVWSAGPSVALSLDPRRLDLDSARLVDGSAVAAEPAEQGAVLRLPAANGAVAGPVQVTFDLR
jgi:alpha-L-fucosidase